MRKILLILFSAFLLSHTASVPHFSNFNIIWGDSFSKNEKEKLTDWLEEVTLAITQTLGKYPFETKLYIYKNKSTHEPVPWAHTVRGSEQAVKFYLSPSFSLQDFKEDWTAQHEIAHLSIPYVGKSNMWFAEGYASFMQYQVMWQQGIYTTAETKEKYAAKLKVNIPEYDSDNSFLEVSAELKKHYNYPAVYWGGACFFIRANEMLLKEKNISLNGVIRKYQLHGRLTDNNLEEVISSLDKVSESKIFSDLYKTFTTGTARNAVLSTQY